MLKLVCMMSNFGYIFTHKLTEEFSFVKYVCNNSLRIIEEHNKAYIYIIFIVSRK